MTLKTVTLTWNDKRVDAPFPGAVKVALWAADGTDDDLNGALAYAAAEQRRTGNVYRVHTWPTDESQWRDKSAAAHALQTATDADHAAAATVANVNASESLAFNLAKSRKLKKESDQ